MADAVRRVEEDGHPARTHTARATKDVLPPCEGRERCLKRLDEEIVSAPDCRVLRCAGEPGVKFTT